MKNYLLMAFFLLGMQVTQAVPIADTTSWLLPVQEIGEDPISRYLVSIGGRFTPFVVGYSQNQATEFKAFSSWNIGANAFDTLDVSGNRWFCQLESDSTFDGQGLAFGLRFRIEKGKASDTGVASIFQFDDWSPDNYVLVPGAVYNGNRFRALSIPYPPMFYDEADQRPDLPITITDVPRLNGGTGPSKLELTTADATTPMVGIFDRAHHRAVIILTRQSTRLGNSGIILEENADRNRAALVIGAPAVRVYRPAGTQRTLSADRGALWEAGDEVFLEFQLIIFECEDLQAFFSRVFDLRKNLSQPGEHRPRTPFSTALRMQEALQNRMRWYGVGRYYKNGNGDSPFGHVQIGWVGGLIQTYPLLVAGDERSQKRSLQTLQTALTKVTATSGFFYGIYRDGKVYGDNFDCMEKRPEVAMVRKNADALYYLMKQFKLLEDAGHPEAIQAAWRDKARALADAFVRLWGTYGQFGQLVNVETGEIVVGGSTAGAAAPGALALASQYFKEPEFLQVAEAAANQYYLRDVARGVTTGGPGEILQNPDSESAYAMLESLVILFEITGKPVWLERARDMAHLFSTWVVSYDYRFPENSRMGEIDARTTGTVWASVQNKHASPGICTASGDALLKLFRATSDTRYLDLLRDITHGTLEFMSTRYRPIGSDQDGYINERVNLSDWEGIDGVGNLHWSSVSWCEVAVMLTATEIPGIYVQPDRGLVYTFDQVETEIIKRDKDRLVLRITNPTAYPADVRILSETSVDAKKPYGWNRWSRLPHIVLKDGESRVVEVTSTGIEW